MNLPEHQEVSLKSRGGLIIKYSKSYFSYDWLYTFLSNNVIVIDHMQSAREHMYFINYVVSLQQIKAKHD